MELFVPSLAVYVNESEPFAFAEGVYVTEAVHVPDTHETAPIPPPREPLPGAEATENTNGYGPSTSDALNVAVTGVSSMVVTATADALGFGSMNCRQLESSEVSPAGLVAVATIVPFTGIDGDVIVTSCGEELGETDCEPR